MPKSPFESPETLVYIGGGGTKPFFGPLTLRRYNVSDDAPIITVESKDVELMLNKSKNGRPLFRRPTVEELISLGQEVEAETALASVAVTNEGVPPIDLEFIFAGFEGIAEKTARKLASAGFTVESLAAGQDEEVAKAAGISVSLAQSAIAGAKKLLDTPPVPPADNPEIPEDKGGEPKE